MSPSAESPVGLNTASLKDEPNSSLSKEQHPKMSYAQFSTPSESSSSGFRNVSACNRCRLRKKNRCDQRLPACSACEKAHVKCVGYDPITKREIPRSYVYSLESRVDYLEALLNDHHISYKPLEAYEATSKPPQDQLRVAGQSASRTSPHTGTQQEDIGSVSGLDIFEDLAKKVDDAERLNKLVSVQGASDPRYLGSTPGISGYIGIPQSQEVAQVPNLASGSQYSLSFFLTHDILSIFSAFYFFFESFP